MPIWDDVISPQEQAVYQRGSWGGRAGWGRRPALLVVDMYRAFVDPAYPYSSPTAPATVAAIRPLLDQARASGVPVLYSRGDVARSPAERGRWKSGELTSPIMTSPEAFQIVSDLRPLPTETVVVKSAPSAFHGTNLVTFLIMWEIDTVILVGTVTSGCVRATAVDAFSYGFRVIIPEECVCDRGSTSHKVALFDIHMKYGDVLPAAEVLDYLRAVKQGMWTEAVRTAKA